MAKIVTKIKGISNINDFEAMVYPTSLAGKQCGAMKVNRSLAEVIDENKLYRISFSNSTEGYNNVATITDIEQVEDETVNYNLFKITGTVSDIKETIKGSLITVATEDGTVIKGGAWKNIWGDYSAANINKGDKVEFFGEVAVYDSSEYVRYNFKPFQETAKQAVKNLINQKDSVSATTTATTQTFTTTATANVSAAEQEVKKAQPEMQKLTGQLIAKGWAVEKAPLSPCTAIGFQPTVNSKDNCVNIIDIRGLEAILKSDSLKQVSKKLFSLKKDVDAEYKSCKELLPAFVPMGQVNSKQRTNETCSSNGLVFLDVDNIEFALCEKILSYIKENEEINSKVLLWNLSPSRKGFHLVFTPFSDVAATIVANQEHICRLINAALGCEIKADGSCTQFSRASFLTSEYYLGGATAVLSADNPTVLPQIETGVVYKPADKKKAIKRTKTADGLPFEAGEYPDDDDISIYIDVEDFHTLEYYAYKNKYVETKRHDWWTKLGIRFRSKNYTQTLAEPIFEYAMEYVQFLPEYKYTVDDPINSNEAYDAFMWAFKKENWANLATPATEIADEDLPLALRPSTTVEDFVYRFAEYEDDMPRLFVDNSTTYFIEKKNLNALPIQIMSTAGLLTAYTSGVKHKDYTERVYKNALQIIPVAPTGTGKSTCTENFELGFGKTMFEEFAFYKTYEEKNDETTNSCVVIGNGTAAKAKKEMFRANKNNFETPVMYVQCSEVGLFRKQQQSQHGGLDFEIIKNGYDGDKYECGTAGKDGVSGFIRNLHLSLNISATVPAIRMHTPTEALNDGAANRMCFCFFKKDYYINPITGHKQKIKTVAQPYNSEAIAQYVDWARRQQGMLDFAEIFGDAGDENNTIYEYFDIHCIKGYEYLKDLTERNYVSAMRVVREYYLMDLYEKGYNLIEHEGKTKVIKDNIITDLPKAEPWMISLVKLCYEYFVYGANKIFGKKAACLNAKHNDIDNDIDSDSKQKKMMYKNIYEALPQSFSREQLVDAVITNFGKTKKTVENIVTNWNKNQVWKFDDSTKLFSKI